MAVSLIGGTGSGYDVATTSNNKLKVQNTPDSTYRLEVALGNVTGAEFRPIFGQSNVNEGVGSEQAVGDGMTTRYPFPTVAAQMTLVSDSANDTFTGSGARVSLVRGNLTNNVELFEAVLLSGTTPVTTTNEYFRVNSIGVVAVGPGSKNEGTITLKNGTDLLAQINPGNNLSRTAIYTVPSGVTGIFNAIDFLTGKDDNAVLTVHAHESAAGGIDFAAFEQKTYQNQIRFETNPFTIDAGTDIEITAYSQSGTGTSDVSTVFDLLLIDNGT